MNPSRTPVSVAAGVLAAIVVLAMFAGYEGAARAADGPPVPCAEASRAARPAASIRPLPLASGWWRAVYAPLEAFLNSRRRMLQFGALGMALALFIIWYRR